MTPHKIISIIACIAFITLGCISPVDNKPTAGDLIERIKENITCDWSQETVDTIKGGNEKIEITGIATTFLATLDVLKRAKAKGLNMVITHEPTYYNHYDETERFEGDEVLSAKQKFIEDNNLVVWRFHDHWHCTQPDGIYEGVVNQLSWSSYRSTSDGRIFNLPETTVKQVAEHMAKVYGSNTIRVVGDPDMKLSQVALAVGAPGSMAQIQLLQRPGVELLIGGETHEWETVEYVRDAISAGKNKALILVGHANSEEAGMKYCAEWLSKFISDVPVEFVAAGDPFWNPNSK